MVQGYIETPVKTLDSLVVNQPRRFLPLAEEAKRLAASTAEAGIPYKQLLNQSFTEQLMWIQTLETLAPLHLAKQQLLDDIIDILERLRKADNIPFNQLYYITENCADRYYTNVIKTFTSILMSQLTISVTF